MTLISTVPLAGEQVEQPPLETAKALAGLGATRLVIEHDELLKSAVFCW